MHTCRPDSVHAAKPVLCCAAQYPRFEADGHEDNWCTQVLAAALQLFMLTVAHLAFRQAQLQTNVTVPGTLLHEPDTMTSEPDAGNPEPVFGTLKPDTETLTPNPKPQTQNPFTLKNFFFLKLFVGQIKLAFLSKIGEKH